MKRLLLASIVIMGIAVIIARNVSSLPGPYAKYGRPAVWQSSRTATQDNFVLVTSSAVHFHGIIISSPTLNIVDSRIAVYNSSSARPMSVGAATVAVVDLGERIYDLALASAPVLQVVPRTLIQFDLYFSSGFAYDKRGGADINLLWDYVNPKYAGPGLTVPDTTFEP